MRTRIFIALAALLLVTACAKREYVVVTAPKKTEAEEKAAKAIAERIFPITNGASLTYLQEELAKPEIQNKIRDMITDKMDNTSLGECLLHHGFGEYFAHQALAQVSPQKLRTETIRLWVEQIPMEMFKKADKAFSDKQFANIFVRLTKMKDGDTRGKLNQLVREKQITQSDANKFFLTTEDRDIKSFLIITYSNGKRSIDNLLGEYKRNPAGIVLDFMKTNAAANNECSLLGSDSL
jgi:hypothetical protein